MHLPLERIFFLLSFSSAALMVTTSVQAMGTPRYSLVVHVAVLLGHGLPWERHE